MDGGVHRGCGDRARPRYGGTGARAGRGRSGDHAGRVAAERAGVCRRLGSRLCGEQSRGGGAVREGLRRTGRVVRVQGHRQRQLGRELRRRRGPERAEHPAADRGTGQARSSATTTPATWSR